ncbi:FCS-Like Zinc finger 11 [Argentina anserina]|uniref:FCS-Like Zinc finger 11 n=1 Tax=Argentina anserina TaxID=57926 RepID=UPI0021763530|nr:FCS-Like Zinc finger 11 [Potentilla anserina]
MLRKRTRSTQKVQDQHQMGHLPISNAGSESHFRGDVLGSNPKSNAFFTVPGLFVGLGPIGFTDSDSVRSPTSTLDFRVFSNLGSPFRSPRSPLDGHKRSWASSKVGLSIIDSLDDDVKCSGKVPRSSESKNILFGPGMRIKTRDSQSITNSIGSPKSLPNNYTIFPHSKDKTPLESSSDVVFEIGETPSEPESFGQIRSCSFDSARTFSTLSGLSKLNPNSTIGNFCLENLTNPQFIEGSPNSTTLMNVGSTCSGNGFVGSLSASEVELSEDYTCVISHGANPKTTHIFGDCILGCNSADLSSFSKHEKMEIGSPQLATSLGSFVQYSNNFLSFCHYCNKELEEGKDIYIYRGEKAFCSLSCRSVEILNDEELEMCNGDSAENPLESDDGKELFFETGLIADN